MFDGSQVVDRRIKRYLAAPGSFWRSTGIVSKIFVFVTVACFLQGVATAAATLEPSGATVGTSTAETVEIRSATTTLTFFFSPTCPHCRKEHAFLDRIASQYPGLTIERYSVEDSVHINLMRTMAHEYGAERSLGNVPLTFVNSKHFVGFDDDATTGVVIEEAIRAALGLEAHGSADTGAITFNVPVLGSLNASQHSFPVLAILLGFLDGFNVCSLGALVLIVGLSLKLQRRRAIVLFGGTYLFVTALVYGALIVVWYHLFEVVAAYLTLMKIGVSLIALGGGLYFLREYLRMRKQGAACTFNESSLVTRMTERTGRAFEDTTRIATILGAIVAFAAVITVVEFPCSAAVPVVFAGMLAQANIPTYTYLTYIALYIIFYLIDEIVVFGIAAYRLKLWMTDGRFTSIAVLVEAIVLTLIGVWYLGATLSLF